MLKIGLLGYGKMGRAIEKIALQQGMEIVWRIQRENVGERTTALLRTADVVIEFSRPEAAFDNVMACLEAGVPVVSGTTGWADELSKAQDFCQKNGGAILWASNFSIGVNLFFALNRFLSQHMSHRGEYQPTITETHHIHKLDAPSGTALTLVNELIAAVPRLKSFALQDQNTIAIPPPETVPITAIREGEVPGTHLVRWQSDVDEITIEHRAFSRAGFASGALVAAQWIIGKRGVFAMTDVLNIQ
jgi:4-hydroxy-tetrahydrodipicolinate reductase